MLDVIPDSEALNYDCVSAGAATFWSHLEPRITIDCSAVSPNLDITLGVAAPAMI